MAFQMDTKNGKKTSKRNKKNVKAIRKAHSTIVEHEEEYVDLHESLSDSIFNDSFDKFLGDRGERRKQLNLKANVRASFNRDSSFDLSTISEPDSTAILPLKATNTVCSTPNLKFGNIVGTLTTPRNDSSDLFASYAGFELNGSQESVTKSQLSSQEDSNRLCLLSETPAKIVNRFDEFISRDRGAGRRNKKTLLTWTDAQTTLPDENEKLNGSHGEACDVKPTEQEHLFQSINMTTDGLEPPITSSTFSFVEKSNEVVEIAEMSTCNDDVDGEGKDAHYVSTSIVQFCSANSSTEEDNDFFERLRKRPLRDQRSELVNSFNSSNRLSASNHMSADSVEAKSSIGQNNTENDRYGSYIEISSELSSSLTNSALSELSKLSERHSNNSANIKLEADNIPSRDPPFSEHESIVAEVVSDAGNREVIRRRIRRTIIEIMKRRVDNPESRGMNALVSSVSASADNLSSDLNSVSAQTSDKSTHSVAEKTPTQPNECNNQTRYSENSAVSHGPPDFNTELGNDTLDPRSNLGNTNVDHSIAAPFFNNECDITTAGIVDDVFRCMEHEQLETSDAQMVSDAGNCEVIRRGMRRTIIEIMKRVRDSSESRRANATGSSVCESTEENSSSDLVSGESSDNSTHSIAEKTTDSNNQMQYSENGDALYVSPDFQTDSGNHTLGPRNNLGNTTIDHSIAHPNSNDEVLHGSSDFNTELGNDTLDPRSNLGNTNVDHSIAAPFFNDECDITAVDSVEDVRCIERPDKSNMSQKASNERADNNVSKRRRGKLKRLVTPVKSSNDIVHSQYVATRKKPKLFDNTVPDVPNISNTIVINDTNTSFSSVVALHGFSPVCSDSETLTSFGSIQKENAFSTDASESTSDPNELNVTPAKLQMLSAVEECNEMKMRKASDIPSSLIQPSTVTNENEASKTGASHPGLSPREHLRDISNTINCVNVTKRKRRIFANNLHLPAIKESSENDQIENGGAEALTSMNESNGLKTNMDNDLHSLTLHPGKWRRSLSLYRRHSISIRSAFLLEQTDVESINSLKISLSNESNRQRLRHSVSFNLSRDNYADLNETSDRRAARRRRTSVVNPIVDAGRLTEFDFRSTYEARDTILRKCGQSEPLEFADVYSQGALRHCRKIGEGVYGEVFMNKTDAGRAIVLKIIPIEGSLEVNGEPQKRFDEVLSEIVIALQLSSLRNDKEYMTSSFAEVVQVRCVQGRYPNHLIDLWELYRDNYQTENDHPEIFGDDQQYIVFELANGGQDLEAFQFSNALQAKSTFQQMALALAIAEKKLQFEHRDLHWGNILLSPTDDKFVNFKFNGNTLQIPSEGIKVTIIDYTLSRMLYDGIVLYNDLSNDDELFTAHGDYQFDIYRLMKSNLGNDWQRFAPFNNILWLHYIVDKLINGARYKNTKSRKHRLAIEDLMVIRDEITNYKSAVESVSNI